MKALGFIKSEDFFRDGSTVVMSLTEAGRRYAIERLGRLGRQATRDDAKGEFLLHTVRTADLYLDVITAEAADWLAVRRQADLFEWFSSNEGVEFIWDALEGNMKRTERHLIPDAVIETSKLRLLVEVERSTKSLKAVMAKIEQYQQLFSPFGIVRDQSAYRDRYSDELAPVVIFAFDSQERADNVAKLVEKRKDTPSFHIPKLMTGTHKEVAKFIRGYLQIAEPKPHPEIGPVALDELRTFVEQFLFSRARAVHRTRARCFNE